MNRTVDTVLDLSALAVLAGLFVVGWLSFVSFQPVGHHSKALLLACGLIAYALALRRLGEITPLVSEKTEGLE